MAGLVQTLPISVKQQESEFRNTDITLETHYPEIYARPSANGAARLIYKKGWSPQEMEFTFEGPSGDDLYLLQTRDMAMRASARPYWPSISTHRHGQPLPGQRHRRGWRGHERQGRFPR